MRIDIMNQNAITSLAMLYAFWKSKRQDLLDLIRPFVLYAVGTTTNIGEAIDITKVCRYMEREFGYKAFPEAVVKRILSRETSSSIPVSKKKIQRKNKHYILDCSCSDLIENFSKKRTECKSKTDAVTSALARYLSQQKACNRTDYTQSEAETILLSFFEFQGSSVMVSVEDLRQLTSKDNETAYFVGKFILAEFDKKSVLMDYLIELVKGYFVTTALYLQSENHDVTKASFSDVTFYLDTRLLLAYLGLKTKEENDSVTQMIHNLQKNGAKTACFPYNIDEVEHILQAYKQAHSSRYKRPSAWTLEHFDENGYSDLSVFLKIELFRSQLEKGNVDCVWPSSILQKIHTDKEVPGLLDEEQLQKIVLSINPNYNKTTLSEDISAINTISRIREGKSFPRIEKCRAVFVTTNTVLVSAVSQYLKKHFYHWGFPIAITAEDLCVIAWLKDFEKNNLLPQMRLLENVMAAITPNQELMATYLSIVDNLEQKSTISNDDAILLRLDIFAKKELMEKTHGKKDYLTEEMVKTIAEDTKANYKKEAFQEGMQKGIDQGVERGFKKGVEQGIQIGTAQNKKDHIKQLKNRKNRACKQIENQVEQEFLSKEKKGIIVVKLISVLVAIGFVVASLISFLSQWDASVKIPLLIVTLISTIQGVQPFFSKNNFAIKFVRSYLRKKKLNELDKRKSEILSILESSEDEIEGV